MSIKLLNVIESYKGLSHQKQAIEALERLLGASGLADDAGWVKAWRGAAQAPPVAQPKSPLKNPLWTPYFQQNDNASGTGYRECFSSSCAMLAAYYGRVREDDEYNRIRSKYGDTTSHTAQLNALTSLSLKPAFATTGSPADLRKEIDAGRPVAVGWLHKGPYIAPSGGGHWSVVIGYTDTHLILHDPNGEADLISGTYVSHVGGKSIHYSFKHFLPRWNVEGPASGWYLTVNP